MKTGVINQELLDQKRLGNTKRICKDTVEKDPTRGRFSGVLKTRLIQAKLENSRKMSLSSREIFGLRKTSSLWTRFGMSEGKT